MFLHILLYIVRLLLLSFSFWLTFISFLSDCTVKYCNFQTYLFICSPYINRRKTTYRTVISPSLKFCYTLSLKSVILLLLHIVFCYYIHCLTILLQNHKSYPKPHRSCRDQHPTEHSNPCSQSYACNHICSSFILGHSDFET